MREIRKVTGLEHYWIVGSQKSNILKSTAEELDLKPLGTEIITHTVFNGIQIEAKPYSRFKGKSQGHQVIIVIQSTPSNSLTKKKNCGESFRIPKALKKNRL